MIVTFLCTLYIVTTVIHTDTSRFTEPCVCYKYYKYSFNTILSTMTHQKQYVTSAVPWQNMLAFVCSYFGLKLFPLLLALINTLYTMTSTSYLHIRHK